MRAGWACAHVQNAQDQKRAKVWGTLAKKIIQAVKAGGADAAANQRLAEVLKQAKQAEVPRDIVERNLKKATDKSQADFAEVGAPSGRSPYLPLQGQTPRLQPPVCFSCFSALCKAWGSGSFRMC